MECDDFESLKDLPIVFYGIFYLINSLLFVQKSHHQRLLVLMEVRRECRTGGEEKQDHMGAIKGWQRVIGTETGQHQCNNRMVLVNHKWLIHGAENPVREQLQAVAHQMTIGAGVVHLLARMGLLVLGGFSPILDLCSSRDLVLHLGRGLMVAVGVQVLVDMAGMGRCMEMQLLLGDQVGLHDLGLLWDQVCISKAQVLMTTTMDRQDLAMVIWMKER